MSDAADRRARVALSGAACVVVLLALAALRFVGWPIDGLTPRVYRAETWFAVGLMTAAAVGAAVLPWKRAALAVAGVCALQLVGTGAVAHRRWRSLAGLTTSSYNLDDLRLIAILLALISALAAVIAASTVWLTRPVDRATGWARVAIGVVAAGAVPLAMGWEPGNRTTQVGAHGLMYGLPWGLAIAGAAILPRRERAAVSIALFAGATVTVLGKPMIAATRTAAGVAVLVVALALAAWSDQRRDATSSSSAVSGVGGASA